MSVDQVDLEQAFDEVGQTVQDASLLARCMQLCSLYELSATDLVMRWEAFAINNAAYNTLDMDTVERFAADLNSKALIRQARESSPPTVRLPVPKSSAKMKRFGGIRLTPGKQASGTKRRQVPIPNEKVSLAVNASPVKRGTGARATGAASASSLAAAAAASSSRRNVYRERANAGEVKLSLHQSLPSAPALSGAHGAVPVALEANSLLEPYLHMYDRLRDQATNYDDRLRLVEQVILQANELEPSPTWSLPSQEPTVATGRICCDADDRLNAASIVLQGLTESGKARISLDVSQLPHYSVNASGRTLHATAMASNAMLPVFEPTPEQLATEPVVVMTAAGPYTTPDNIAYDPLEDLMEQVSKVCPSVLIMMGPFVDSNNQVIQDCALDCTFDELFDRLVRQHVLPRLPADTHLVLVPHEDDVHHIPVLPQPPFRWTPPRDASVTLAPNPAKLRIGGMAWTVCSSDVMAHLASAEIARRQPIRVTKASLPMPNQVPSARADPDKGKAEADQSSLNDVPSTPVASDRMERLVSHVLQQRCLYPSLPQPRGVSVDSGHLDHLSWDKHSPQVLVVPSMLNQFAKRVSGVLAVNPGRLIRGPAGGTYATLAMQPVPDPASMDEASEAKDTTPSLWSRTRVDIIRV